MLVYCSCGCGGLFEEFDSRGRKRRFVVGHSNKGKKFSKEHNEKISKARIGIKLTEEHKKNLSISHKGFQPVCKFKKGNVPWNKGKKCPEISEGLRGKHPSSETLKKQSESHKGKILSEETKKRIGDAQRGDKHWNWNGGITSLTCKIRLSDKYLDWRYFVFKRDCFTCQKCGIEHKNIIVHHKKPFSEIIGQNNIVSLETSYNCLELWDIGNGICLCENCHKELHKQNGSDCN